MGADRTRKRVTIVGGLVVVALVAGIVAWRSTDDGPAKGPKTNELFDEDGNLALAMPSLASDIEVKPNDDGSSEVTFSITYDVAHPGEADPPAKVEDGKVTAPKEATPKPDMGAITVQVSEAMGPGGPIRLSPMTTQTQFDRKLTEATTTNDYSFRLNPKTTAFLNGKGLDSKDDDTRAEALRYIDIDVEHLRDWKSEDGKYDWQQGRAYTAQDKPVKASDVIVDDSTMTVNNATNEGVFGPTFQGGEDALGVYDYDTWNNQLNDTSTYGTPISLSGQAIECIDQGDGSNPQGFSMLNGWDLEDDLPPGILPPGASVTQQVNANDGLGTSSLDIAEQTTTATVQVLASAIGTTTPGLKSAISTAVLLGMGLTEFAAPVAIALGVPIKAILELVEGIYDAMTNSCASFANVVNLTAAEPAGAMTSISWGDQTNGLDLTYSSATYKGSPVTNNVAVVPSNGIVTTEMANGSAPYNLNPYLEQAATVSCGDGSGSGSGGGCSGGSGNNVIDVRWTTEAPCPFSDGSDCDATEEENASLPPISVPGTDLCGTENELCTVNPAPNQDAQESTDENLAGVGYIPIFESNPDDAVSAIASNEDGDIWYGDDQGSVWSLDDFGNASQVLTSTAGAVSGMYARDSNVIWSGGDQLNVWDTSVPFGQSGSYEAYQLPDGDDVEHLQWDGNTSFYLATDSDLYAWTEGQSSIDTIDTSDWSVDGNDIESMWANGQFLFVGFQSGYIERCDVSDCAGTWEQIHDGGFNSAVQAMTSIGDTLYVGLGDGGIAQMDSYGGGVSMAQGALDMGGQVAGMANVEGNVYVGGCLSNQDDVSGDWLGLQVLTAYQPDTSPTWNPNLLYYSCQNPSSTTSQLKGFSDANYAITSTPATQDHGALVILAQDIKTENYLYVLENTNRPTDATCISSWGDCPSPPAVPAAPTTNVAPAGSIAALGQPVMNSTCGAGDTDGWWTAASDSSPISTSVGESVTDGFQLTPPTGSDGCTTTYAWNLNGTGTLPYDTWQANAYPAASADAVGLGIATEWGSGLPVTANGQALTTGAQARPLSDGIAQDPPTNSAAPTKAEVASTGVQLQVDVSNGAPMLVLQVATEPNASSGSTSIVFTNDVLTSDGQATPGAVPLFVNPSTTTTTTAASSTSSSTSTTVAGSTTSTTSANTTTTTRPSVCGIPVGKPASSGDAVWPLDDRSTTAADVSGNGNDATIANAAAYDQTPGPLASCATDGGLVFDGSSTSVTAPDAVTVNGDEMTVMAFVNAASSSPGPGTVIADDDPAQTGNGLAMGIEAGSDGSIYAAQLDLGLSTGAVTATWEREAALAPDQWHLLVGTYDGSTGAVTLYLDGQQVATASAPAGATIEAGGSAVTLGVDPDGNQDWFDGQMADAAVLSQALTAQQVAAIWAAAQGS
ncbi:MAG: LamG domain-containing protein [Aquihabitans sp.]